MIRTRVLCSAFCIALSCLGAVAQGQMTFTTTQSIGSEEAAPLGGRHVEKFAEVLALDADQRSTLDNLFTSYGAEYTVASVERSEKLGDLRAEVEESGDYQILMEEMPAVRKEFNDRVEAITESFFSDLQLILTAEQEARWPALERTRRRLASIGDGVLAGESVDLVEITDDMDIPEGDRAELAPTLEQYEIELDRALVRRDELRAETSPSLGAGSVEFDLDAMQDAMGKARDASVEVRDVNVRHARQIRSLLDVGLAEELDAAIRKASFPNVYAETYTTRIVSSARGFEDLTPDQRDQLDLIAARYERELEDLNVRWARAIEENEENQRSAILTGPGGEPMVLRIGEESEEVKDARTARRGLNRDMLAKVRGLLSADQRSRLPEREPRRLPGGSGSNQMMFMEIATEGDMELGEDVESGG